MLTAYELSRLRADQEALMHDTVSISRPGGLTWDEAAQHSKETWEPIYAGPGRLAADPVPSVLGADGSIRQDRGYMLTVPHTVTLAPGDRVTTAHGTTLWVHQTQKAGIMATATRAHCTTTHEKSEV